MCTKTELNAILDHFIMGIKDLFGDQLKGVILYGSYARGDFDNESDIDVLILVDISKKSIVKYIEPVIKIAEKADWDYDSLLSPIIKNYTEFEQYKSIMPFYKNVDHEGVRLIA